MDKSSTTMIKAPKTSYTLRSTCSFIRHTGIEGTTVNNTEYELDTQGQCM